MFDLTNSRILVVGDVMLDQFLYGSVERISPEAPVPVVLVRDRTFMLGGAGNVARNIVALGGRAALVGIRGNDGAGKDLACLLRAEAPGIEDYLVEQAARPTICKIRIIGGAQQMLRLDEESTEPGNEAMAMTIVAALSAAVKGSAAIILSDYGKGVLSRRVVQACVEAAREARIPLLADPKTDDFTLYNGATVITPNSRELSRAARMPTDTEAEVVAAAHKVIATTGVRAVLCTRAERGMILVTQEGGVEVASAEAQEVFDVSGAGDTAIATLALAHASGRPLPEAMRIANAAAGIVVGKLGTATVGVEELAVALRSRGGAAVKSSESPLDWETAKSLVRTWRSQGLRVGFTNGCFDILHAGHVALLRTARQRCDRLIVALNSDASVARLKGSSRPLNTLADRACVVAALSDVDAVVAFDQDTPLGLIHTLVPDVLVKGADYTLEQVVGADFIRSSGGEVLLVELLPGRSTTSILDRGRSALT